MLLCLDIGNTHILGGVFNQNQLVARFRYATNLLGTSDQFGIFLLNLFIFNVILFLSSEVCWIVSVNFLLYI